jgi:hypothetical protein
LNSIKLINSIREALDHVKKSGQTTVAISDLQNYLADLEKSALSSVEAAAAQQKFENDVEITKINTAHSIEMFKSVIEAGLNALKSAIIINGGAAVALLAFISGLIEKSSRKSIIPISDIAYALFIFVIGAGFAGTASAIRYLCQASYARALEEQLRGNSESRWNSLGGALQIASIITGATSFVAFFYGGWLAYVAFKQH